MPKVTVAKVRLSLAALVVFAFVVACQSTSDQLLGRWELVGQETNVIEFLKEDTIIWGGATGTYTLIDDKTFRLDGVGGSYTMEFSVSDDRLSITKVDGEATDLVFHRADD